MTEIRLTPSASLRWDSSGEQPEDKTAASLRELFECDWREGLFSLAAQKNSPAPSPTVRFWQGFAEKCLVGLCHLPETMSPEEMPGPSAEELSDWVLGAPPMQGGEYLSPETLGDLWRKLLQWCTETAEKAGGMSEFLQERAPRWHQVGRVCFHLAENKATPERPFAFMATYVSGLGVGGRARHLPLRQALEQYSGTHNRAALVKLLSPVQAAAERCPWVQEMVDSGEIYQPRAWTPERAYHLLLSVPVLEECGLTVRLPDWWRHRQRPRVAVTIGAKKPSLVGLNAMLDFDMSVALGDQQLTPEEVQQLLEGPEGLVLLKGQWVEVDREKLREAISQWLVVRNQVAKNDGISFIEGMRLLSGASQDLKQEEKAEKHKAWVHVEAGEALRQILAQLRDPARLEADEDGTQLRALLRPYQRQGVAWLHFLTELGLGACLADDMGLGKTIQVLALLLRTGNDGAEVAGRTPSLLVVPASLLGNWRAEAERFAPTLRLEFLHPAEAERTRLETIEKDPENELAQTDLAITTYSMLARQEWLGKVNWRMVIVDEAQAIKNPSTRQSHAVKKLKARSRVALTGTPVENRLGDLWSIFDFLNPGLLGSASTFKSFIRQLETRETDQFAPLRQLVAPYILRRLKTDRSIIADLPEKIETLRYCSLTRAQVRLYEQTVKSMERALSELAGIERRGLVLQTLMRLKQICNHPSQFSGDGEYDPEQSGKFQRVAEICEEIDERQERVLVFTQFREIIDPLSAHLDGVFGRPGLVLHGETSVQKRRGLVEAFQREDGPPFFILSLKAGGTGLNLTAASHVIHFDRWWNPAVEDQATDRAFRIGQKKNVLVHKFVTSGTVEQQIEKMITQKRQVAGEILAPGQEVDLTALSDEQLMQLVRLDVSQALV